MRTDFASRTGKLASHYRSSSSDLSRSPAAHWQPRWLAPHLSHGDDPYNSYTFTDPAYSMSELLLDQTKFDSWFGSGVSEEAKCKNIDRRVEELAIQYLPAAMLRDYCNDQEAGKSHAHGVVAENMHSYTVAQLEAHHLWSRMDAKIASIGGCLHVPYP